MGNVCLEAEQFGAQSAAEVDAHVAQGMSFESNVGTGKGASATADGGRHP